MVTLIFDELWRLFEVSKTSIKSKPGPSQDERIPAHYKNGIDQKCERQDGRNEKKGLESSGSGRSIAFISQFYKSNIELVLNKKT